MFAFAMLPGDVLALKSCALGAGGSFEGGVLEGKVLVVMGRVRGSGRHEQSVGEVGREA